MHQSNQDYAARRSQPFETQHARPRYNAGYECELPNDVRQELSRPRRGFFRQRPTTRRSFSGWLAIGLAGLGLAVLLAVVSSRKPITTAPDLVLEHSGAALAQQQAQQAVLPSAPGSTARAAAPNAPKVPKALLVRLPDSPAPRAQRILHPGDQVSVMMPDGALTPMRFLGIKDSFTDLPRDPQLGDGWQVLEGGGQTWIWHTLPGHVASAWVDP